MTDGGNERASRPARVIEAEERAQFTLAMRAKGVGDLGLLRALERAPRAMFVPQRFADIAGRDIALPIGCGQTSPPPSTLAAMIEALAVQRSDRICEIGTGTGYCTALLAQLGQSIVSFERCQALAVEAAARLKAFGLDNAEARWADGFAWARAGERYDKAIVHGLIASTGEPFFDLVGEGGALVAVVVAPPPGGQRVWRFTRAAGGETMVEDFGPARTMRPLAHGLARGL